VHGWKTGNKVKSLEQGLECDHYCIPTFAQKQADVGHRRFVFICQLKDKSRPEHKRYPFPIQAKSV
jgi:hypothetical protein